MGTGRQRVRTPGVVLCPFGSSPVSCRWGPSGVIPVVRVGRVTRVSESLGNPWHLFRCTRPEDPEGPSVSTRLEGPCSYVVEARYTPPYSFLRADWGRIVHVSDCPGVHVTRVPRPDPHGVRGPPVSSRRPLVSTPATFLFVDAGRRETGRYTSEGVSDLRPKRSSVVFRDPSCT